MGDDLLTSSKYLYKLTIFCSSISGNIQGGSWDFSGNLGSTQKNFADEPPLLEELGIDIQKIYERTISVLNPMKKVTSEMMTSRSQDGQV
jgi:hypothetical protein